MTLTLTTLNKYIAAGNTLPDILDEPTKTLVTDWFGARYVNKDKFSVYMERQCNLDYPRYLQMLRVDPISAKYDWFVEFYKEHKSTTTGTGSDVSTGKTTTNGTSSGTSGVVQDTTGSGSDTVTHGMKVDTTNGGSTEKTTSGSNSDTSDNSSKTIVADSHDEVSRIAPMSAEFSAVDSQVDYELASDAGDQTITLRGGMASPGILNPSSSGQSREVHQTGTINGSKSSGTSSETDSTTTSGTGSQTTSGTDTTARSNTGKTTTDTTAGGSTSGESETNGTVSHTTNDTVKSQDTGRTKSIADIVSEACVVIRTTSAWVWFRDELDKCFIQSYNVDDDDYDMSIEVE